MKVSLVRQIFLLITFLIGPEILELGQGFDRWLGASEISAYMDLPASRIYGPFHRLYQGHDLLFDFLPMLKEFGFWQLPKILFEFLRDFLTPFGLPLPGIRFLLGWELGGLRLLNSDLASHWLSLNLWDLLSLLCLKVFLPFRPIVNLSFPLSCVLIFLSIRSSSLLAIVYLFRKLQKAS